MISKLPRWVEYGAFILALVAGFVNAIGLLGLKYQAVSHLSGTATLLGTGIVNESFIDVGYLLLLLLSFVVGASISGVFLRGGSLKLGHNYGGLLILEALLLFAAMAFLNAGYFFGYCLASAACGLQNALATTYSGAIIRTTHLTGIFTDLGLMLGAKLRGQAFDKRKALLFILLIAGFVIGSCFGAYAYALNGFYALLIPACICLLLALSYKLYNIALTKTNG